MHYKYFFFDFDGMLCDSYDHITNALITTLKETRNITYPYKEVYNAFKINFATAFKTFNVTETEKKIFIKRHEDINFKPYPKLYLPVIKLLQSIIESGGLNFIYTNRNESLYDYLKFFKIDKYFKDCIISACKPETEKLLSMIEKYDLDKSKCVVVGDRTIDVLAAYQANIDGILYDAQSTIFMHRATHVIKKISELYNFIDLPYKIKNNYHTHTCRCGHAIGDDEQYILKAIEQGYQILGMSDHVNLYNIERNYEYFDSMALLKEKYKDQIEIKIALEVEYHPNYLSFYKKILDDKHVDYLIFGNHFFLNDKNEQISFMESFEDISYLDIYYDILLKAVETKMFKYIAHPDVFMKGYQKWDEHTIELTHKIAKLLETNNLYAELSAQCCRSQKKMEYEGKLLPAYPFEEFYKILSKYNIKFVLGVDAHSPSHFDDQGVKYICDMAKRLQLDVEYVLKF